ncbi:MAG TPA: sulfurtransferase TusA [Candidatus Anaerobiospirillum stercoravium]|nr:sulfurtransferase TusA [Candidatus Anaerobiospirillum stercoravium]
MLDDPNAPTLSDTARVSAERTAANADSAADSNVAGSAEGSTEGNAEIGAEVSATVDGLGLSCPEPLMLLRKQVRASKSGDLIALLSDDPVSLRDVPAFCDFMHHTLVSLPDAQHPHRFLIRKG